MGMFFLPTSGAHSGGGFAAIERNGDVYLRVYNATGASLAAGVQVYLKWVYNADETKTWQIVALVDDALRHVIGVVDSLRASSGSGTTPSGAIADSDWGFIKVKGTIKATTASITTVQGEHLKILDAAAAAAGAAPYADTTYAGCLEASTATTHDIVLFGREFLATT